MKDCQEAKKEECNRILPCYSTWNRQQDTFHEEDDFQRYLDTTKKLSLESGVSVQDYWLSIPHCPKGLDIDTEEPSPCVLEAGTYRRKLKFLA
ncbi:hypothetical protein [Desulfosporosinus sp.]|uniref:hypothetical protein n=1 Tax=Desulfosporosinus sp. TaxID=157907 RepID=UPI0025BA066D|nr:hypothetical protein [Desulfosporosinus sp.]MBC2724190.1 hypothetical protein [Desulfosporosinus sp.]MBC2726724.1 hypothetical protein [Desulfosporosinus sp.]